jgi:NAD(P)-dependent dehydrogenase (short-subunit alcohol dehydrogenase family)
VCLSDIDDEELARSARDLAKDGTECLSVHLDVSDLSGFLATVREVVNRWGRLDALIQNAIYMPLITFEETTPESWRQQIDVGLGGLFNGTRAVWDLMKDQGGGHIIGVASGSSVRGYPKEIGYCTVKHGQEGFVKALSLEAGKHNIALNTIGVSTPIKPTRMSWVELDRTPQEVKAGWADPVELGKAWAWLASQPPSCFSGYRFDAADLIRTIAAEGYDFAFAPEKVTRYVEDFRGRQEWYAASLDSPA